jgi:hypothetical protein
MIENENLEGDLTKKLTLFVAVILALPTNV